METSLTGDKLIHMLDAISGPHEILWATDYPHQDGFFPGAPQMLRDRLGPLSAAAKHQMLAGGAMGSYALN